MALRVTWGSGTGVNIVVLLIRGRVGLALGRGLPDFYVFDSATDISDLPHLHGPLREASAIVWSPWRVAGWASLDEPCARSVAAMYGDLSHEDVE